jgi:phenylpropionate dioxygenase-like ring-hydroxylating dioxygenase large terminal subunit
VGRISSAVWQPVILASELCDLLKSLRILSEDLVVCRDRSGAIGVVEPYCPHRGTSTEYGLI